MHKYKIPKANADLRRYALWKNLKYLLGYIAYIALMASAFLFFLNGRHENLEPLRWWVYPVFCVAVLISGWFIFCMNRFVGDRSFTGRIVSMTFKRDFDRGLNRQAGLSVDDHTYVKITVTDAKGRRRRTKVMLFDDGYDGYFREGRTLVKYRGLNYPLCLQSEEEGVHLCSVCGVRTYYKEGKMIHGETQPKLDGNKLICRACGHTLIDK